MSIQRMPDERDALTGTKALLRDHDQSIKKWYRQRLGGPEPCWGCRAEVECWWSYCAMCGEHLAAGKPR